MSTAHRLLDDSGVQRVLTLLDANGEEARIVGGAIRNTLLGRPVTDIDIATTATPDVVIERAKTAGLRTIPTGIAHGTVTIRVEARSFEVTTLREDMETDGRHAKVRFGRDFARDALRRDFTINALSMGLDGQVHDYADGLADIAAGLVRFIGDPETRIREDYLRILRFFRFSADYATGPLDEAALSACIRQRDGMAHLSRERIRQELLKLLAGRRAVFAVTEMSNIGLLGDLLSSVPQPLRLERLLTIDPAADAILRLTATAAIVAEDGLRLQDPLRLSNAESQRIATAAAASSGWRGAEAPLSGDLRRSLFENQREGAIDGLKLAWADSSAAPKDADWQHALAFLRDSPEPRLPFSGADLLARGVTAGKPLGAALKRLQANWIRAGFPSDPRRLGELLDEVTRP